MDATLRRRHAPPPQPTFAELFTPKLVSVLREGYGFEAFRADIVSGLTVAIVALPLSMAIAIASGTTPDRGLYAAIFGGFLVSLLGGSRFQIGGPAGAFIVLVAASVARHGIDGVILATMIAGLILIVAGFLRLGTYIKFIPYPVTVGFTAGIAVIIFASQIRDLLGITLSGKEPGELIPKLEALAHASGTINPGAVSVSVATIATPIPNSSSPAAHGSVPGRRSGRPKPRCDGGFDNTQSAVAHAHSAIVQPLGYVRHAPPGSCVGPVNTPDSSNPPPRLTLTPPRSEQPVEIERVADNSPGIPHGHQPWHSPCERSQCAFRPRTDGTRH